MLTKSAIERITKDISTKTSSLSTTTGISLEPAIQTHQTSEDEASTEEEKERDPLRAALPTAKKAATTQAQNNGNPTTNTKFRIIKSPITINLFEPPPSKNRRFTATEFQTELELASIFHRPPRTYVKDPPFYPWLPPEPLVNQPYVTFDLGFK